MWLENYRTDLENCMESDWCGVFWINFWGATLYCKDLCDIIKS